MKKYFSSFLFFVICGSCFAELQPPLPPNDGRTQRAIYVSSFIKPGDIGAEIGETQGSFAYHVLFQKNPKKLFTTKRHSIPDCM